MFEKIALNLEGNLYNIKVKKIKEEDLYTKKEYNDFKGVEILNQDFISLKDFNLKTKTETEEFMPESSGEFAFLNNNEMKESNSITKVDNLIAENLINEMKDQTIVMEISKYKFKSPKIKLKGSEFNKYKVKVETTDLEALTDYLVDEEVIYSIAYNGKKVNYQKQGLIFVDKIDKELISRYIATFNMDDDNPCLENKFKLN